MNPPKPNQNNVVGIDASLTNTAMYFGKYKCEEVKGGKERGARRLNTMREKILNNLYKHRPKIAVIEGYAFGGTGRQHRLGEIGGIVRQACVEAGVQVIYEVPPTTLKKFFTGKGKAGKPEMQAEAVKRGCFSSTPSDDLADACALWHAAFNSSLLQTKAETEIL